ncbi:MAG: MBL fold metallo-hydrolase [Candidatus Aminicenantes bacterium]|jgi:glyoxylase-like metal-dependent hydrolase (beta-lactamase superfamily II)
MKKLPLFLLVLFLFFGQWASPSQIPDLKNVRIITTHVAGPVYMLEATGDVAGNIGVSAGPDGILLIDTQFAPLADRIEGALQSITDGKIRYIVNTHHHEDHSFGNRVLGQRALIISHSKTQSRLLDMSPENRPDLSFEKKMSIFFNREEIQLVHFPPGHTDNDVVVHFTKSNVFHLGDLWNSGISSFPTVDIDAGGSVRGMLKNLEDLIKIIPPDAKIIPGHYALSDLNDLERTRTMLVETLSLVQNKMETGKSLEEIKAEGLPSKYEKWGTAYTSADKWIENAYKSLQKEKSADIK